MDNAWAIKLWNAQRLKTFTIRGRVYKRIRYGKESRTLDSSIPCHDCGAYRGMFHGPGCDMEKCPACRRQLLSCGCLEEWPE
jgi:hypothetical protein